MDPNLCPTPAPASNDHAPHDLFFPEDIPTLSGRCMGIIRPIYMKSSDFELIPDPRIFYDYLVRLSYCHMKYPWPSGADEFGWMVGFDVAFDVPGKVERRIHGGDEEYVPRTQDFLEWLAEAGKEWKERLKMLGEGEWWVRERGEGKLGVVLRGKKFLDNLDRRQAYIDSAPLLARMGFTTFPTRLPPDPHSPSYPPPVSQRFDLEKPMCGVCVVRQESERLRIFVQRKRFVYGYPFPERKEWVKCWGMDIWRQSAFTSELRRIWWEGLRLPPVRRRGGKDKGGGKTKDERDEEQDKEKEREGEKDEDDGEREEGTGDMEKKRKYQEPLDLL